MSDENENVINLRPRGSLQPPPAPPLLPPALRHQPPELPAAPPTVSDDRGDDETSVLPSLPPVADMRPPLSALPVPSAPPLPEPLVGEEGEFVPPPPADPDNPTAQEVLATAMALVTALGVAAAQGMWHRARHRSALADKTRAGADKQASKAAAGTGAGAGGTRSARGAGSSGSSGGAGSLLRSPAGDSKRRDKGSKGRAFGRRAGGGGGGDRPAGGGKGSRGPKSKGPGGSGPKAARGGKAAPKGGGAAKRAWGFGKGGTARPKGKSRDKATGPAGGGKPSKPKSPRGAGKDDAAKPKGKGGPQTPKLTWKAPKKGADKDSTAKPKRWTTGRTKGAPGSKGSKRAGRSWAWKTGTRWWKRWRTRHTATAPTFTEATTQETGTSRSDHDTEGRDQGGARKQAPPPPPGWEGMRPPPGADRTTRVTVERVDHQAQQPEPLALTEGPRALTAPAKTTQYADAELTIFDVIDAAADMAAEITDGVTEAQQTAEGCDVLFYRLEVLHAKVVELRVPGVLEGLVVALMEQTGVVKALAEGIAANLPRAAEAIQVAGSNAEARHRPLADAVRDAGHIRPAERDYHQE